MNKTTRVSVLLSMLVIFTLGMGLPVFAQKSGSNITLLGSGATFPAPFYSKIFDVYASTKGVKVNYQAIGSSGGLKNIMDKVVDFGGSDSFVKDADYAKYSAPIVHIPTVIGAVVLTYNLPGVTSLRMTGDVIANIYLGKISRWDDARITALNPGVKLPKMAIMPVYRSDGSGTTFNFTAYLASISKEWKEKVGNANSVSWLAGQGAAQNAGVAAVVQQTPGSVGYVELAYANQNKMPVVSIKNAAGNWIEPNLNSISKAAALALPADTRILLANTQAPEGYPICALTWIIVYKEQNYSGRTIQQARELVNLLSWIVRDGQKYANELDYATLPEQAVKTAEAVIKSITYDGKPIL